MENPGLKPNRVYAIFETLDGAKKEGFVQYPLPLYVDFAIFPPMPVVSFEDKPLTCEITSIRRRTYELFNDYWHSGSIAHYREVY